MPSKQITRFPRAFQRAREMMDSGILEEVTMTGFTYINEAQEVLENETLMTNHPSYDYRITSSIDHRTGIEEYQIKIRKKQ